MNHLNRVVTKLISFSESPCAWPLPRGEGSVELRSPSRNGTAAPPILIVALHTLHAYSDEVGRVFRFQAGQHSDAKPATAMALPVGLG